MPTTTVAIKLDQDTKDRLKALGEARDRSPHWLMKQAIARYLDAEEAFEQEKAEDEAVWQRYLESGGFLDDDEVAEWLDGLARSLAATDGTR